jgi:hypothetical protein
MWTWILGGVAALAGYDWWSKKAGPHLRAKQKIISLLEQDVRQGSPKYSAALADRITETWERGIPGEVGALAVQLYAYPLTANFLVTRIAAPGASI